MNKPLTARQKEIYLLIREHIRDTGMPPTRSEIARALGFRSVNAAEQHLRALANKGMIELLPGTSRGLRLLHPDEAMNTGLPVIGRVAAGSPILAEQHIERHCEIDPNIFSPPADYLLRVRGMSMRDAGILDDDLLAVHRTRQARSGDVVVARLGDEVTVKRLLMNGHTVRLMAENPDFAHIDVDAEREDLAIEGIAVGVIRNMRPL